MAMISDSLFECISAIEECERKWPECYEDVVDDLRRLKVEMRLTQLQLDLPLIPPYLYDIADYEWLRVETLKRAATALPCKTIEVFGDCLADLQMTKFGRSWKTRREDK
jgi:hypothetical protein